MNTVKPQAKSIFGQALAIETAEERAAYLENACAGDAALRAEVEGLLATQLFCDNTRLERSGELNGGTDHGPIFVQPIVHHPLAQRLRANNAGCYGRDT